MTLVGPVVLIFGDPATGEDFGDFVTNIVQNAPAPIVLPAINRDYSASPSRGYSITATGVQESLEDGTFWRYLYDHFDEKDVPLLWSPLGAGDVYFQSEVASIPDPSVGGAANAHGTFDITITLVDRPVIVANPNAPLKGSASPGDVFPAEATITASDSTNAAKLAGLGFVADPTTAWTTGQKITVGTFDFNWSSTAWAEGAHAVAEES